jgi:hypothetical protein
MEQFDEATLLAAGKELAERLHAELNGVEAMTVAGAVFLYTLEPLPIAAIRNTLKSWRAIFDRLEADLPAEHKDE